MWWVRSDDALVRGRAAYGRRDLPRALDAARQAVAARPDDPDALRLLARASFRLGRHSVARGIYERLGRAAVPLEAEDHYLLAVGLMDEGRREEALTALEAARAADPGHAETLERIARSYAASERFSAALEPAERLAATPGWEARGLLILGGLRADLADPAAAADALSRALRLDPRLAGSAATPVQVRKLLARDLLLAARPAEAQVQLDIVLERGPDAEASWLAVRTALQTGNRAAALAALTLAGDYGKDRPDDFEPAPFVGAARCAECHRDIHRLATSNRHAKTFTPANRLDALQLPASPVVDPHNPDVVHSLTRHGSRIEQQTHVADNAYRALVVYAMGSGDRGLTPVGRDENGAYRELRLSYYGDIDGWDRTTGHIEKPADADLYVGVPLTDDAVRRCLDCHTTNFRAARDGVGPEAADRGIGCERCHGPAGNHLAAMSLRIPDPAIGRPRLASPEQVTALCGQCHSPRGRRASENSPDAVRFQVFTLTRSRCYLESNRALSCLTCHNPHHDASTAPDFYEAKCLACHGPAPASPAAPAASRHVAALPAGARRVPCPVNPSRDCLDCHMPAVKTIIPHSVFTDHLIRVHREPATNPAE
jgi:tetratricopeptide (TPR) repeat protein